MTCQRELAEEEATVQRRGWVPTIGIAGTSSTRSRRRQALWERPTTAGPCHAYEDFGFVGTVGTEGTQGILPQDFWPLRRSWQRAEGRYGERTTPTSGGAPPGSGDRWRGPPRGPPDFWIWWQGRQAVVDLFEAITRKISDLEFAGGTDCKLRIRSA